MKRLIAFDLDGTLAASKSPVTDRMTRALTRLLDHMQMCVISGGTFGQFERQPLSHLRLDPHRLANLHLMPTCGTRYYTYDVASRGWRLVYAEDFTEAEKLAIVAALDKGFDDLGYRGTPAYGDYIEDRGSQVTFSAYGQDIVDVLGSERGVAVKEAWDPDRTKKAQLRDYIAELIPDFEVRIGGVTSIDVTRLGIDKAYGIRRLIERLEIGKEEVLFLGDALQPGGNDYPVLAMGVDSLEVARWEDTATVVEGILHVL